MNTDKKSLSVENLDRKITISRGSNTFHSASSDVKRELLCVVLGFVSTMVYLIISLTYIISNPDARLKIIDYSLFFILINILLYDSWQYSNGISITELNKEFLIKTVYTFINTVVFAFYVKVNGSNPDNAVHQFMVFIGSECVYLLQSSSMRNLNNVLDSIGPIIPATFTESVQSKEEFSGKFLLLKDYFANNQNYFTWAVVLLALAINIDYALTFKYTNAVLSDGNYVLHYVTVFILTESTIRRVMKIDSYLRDIAIAYCIRLNIKPLYLEINESTYSLIYFTSLIMIFSYIL